MGIVPLSLRTLQTYIGAVGGFGGCNMLELGDQQMYANPNIPEGSAAKSFLTQLGVNHTSIDMNGELGAIPLDLSKPIDKPEWLGAFDAVTDFGTSEHVGKSLEALYNCRHSCHQFARQGGLLLFMNPKKGNWPGHGYHYFTKEHYIALCKTGKYRALEISEHPTLGNNVDGWQVHAVLIKMSAAFLTLEEYTELCKETVFPS